MALYLYIKESKEYPLKRFRRQYLPDSQRLISQIFSATLVMVGLGLLFLAGWPILSWQTRQWLMSGRGAAEVKSPLADSYLQVAAQDDGVNSVSDLTRASNWFPQAIPEQTRPTQVRSYLIKIPKLGIEKAIVIIGGEDLSKSLIQWGGTALPGDLGNTVIFGHSTLPFLFDQNDYKTIFSYLPSLQVNDEIYLTFDGLTYKYIVYDQAVVSPKETSVLDQDFSDSFLTLITCVPPGTYWKRHIIKAKLEKI